jgi:hypothetical protein
MLTHFVPAVKAQEHTVFSDGFEGGDFSAWSWTDGTVEVVTSPVHHGSYAAKFTGHGSDCGKTLPSTYDDVYVRVYIRLTSVLDAYNFFNFLYLWNQPWSEFVAARVIDDGTAMRFSLGMPSGWLVYTGLEVQTGTWYCVEVRRKVGSGNGVASLWINGELALTSTTETVTGGTYEITFGLPYSGQAGYILYGDCVVVADTYIGAELTPASSSIFRILADGAAHNDYGLTYPVTYIFSIPTGVTSAKCYYRFTSGESWSELPTKTSDDFFNGVNAVRFDYYGHRAFVSIGFSAYSDNIYLKFTDEDGDPIECSFDSIAKYYDNRRMVVTISADDWDGNSVRHTRFMNACDVFQNASVWLTVSVCTVGHWYEGASPIWRDIQSQLDEGFIEIASHSRTHTGVPYADYDSEIGGSKNDIIGNLSLPSFYKMGDTEYVYTWIEPGGESDVIVRQKLGEYKYLISRSTNVEDIFATWDSENGLYKRVGVSICGDHVTIEQLNNAFDHCYNNFLIYHMCFHPYAWWIEGGGNWDNGIITQHLDYIKGKRDIWYVGLGALYAYHFVQERGIIQVSPETLEKILWSDGFDDGNLEKWDAGSGGTVQSVVKHSGVYAVQFSGTWQRATKTLPPTSLAYARIYVYFSDLPGEGNVITILSFYSSLTFAPDICVGVKNDGGVIKWGITWDTWQVGPFASASNPTTGVWYCVELRLTVTEGVGYSYEVWIDGISIITQSRTTSSAAKFDKFLIGGWDRAEPLTNYVDSVLVSKVYVDS